MVISSDGDVVVEYVIQYQYKLRWEIIVEANLDHICCLAERYMSLHPIV